MDSKIMQFALTSKKAIAGATAVLAFLIAQGVLTGDAASWGTILITAVGTFFGVSSHLNTLLTVPAGAR